MMADGDDDIIDLSGDVPPAIIVPAPIAAASRSLGAGIGAASGARPAQVSETFV